MPAQGRIGDKSHVPICNHGCPACPHPCIGPGVLGSPTVKVNGRPALRMDDAGIHGGCCMKNDWEASSGSATVFINGKPAHRMGDEGEHCGGLGKLNEGSSNVMTGGPEQKRMQKLQLEMQKQQQMNESLSNIQKSISDTKGDILQNMKGPVENLSPETLSGEGGVDQLLSGGSTDLLGGPSELIGSPSDLIGATPQLPADPSFFQPISNIAKPLSELKMDIIKNFKP